MSLIITASINSV